MTDSSPIIEQIQARVARATAQARSRPFVTLSYAQSLDGCIAARPGARLPISGPAALALTHGVRAAHDAILVGIGTVLADDPRLTVRLAPGRSPQPVVVDSRLRLPPDCNLVRCNPHRPWVAISAAAEPSRAAALTAAGARLLCLPTNAAGQIDLAALLTRLAALGVRSLMVEGGARIITSFLAARLVDHLVLTVAPLLVGGRHAVDDLGCAPAPLPRLRDVHYDQVGTDLIVRGDLAWEAP